MLDGEAWTKYNGGIDLTERTARITQQTPIDTQRIPVQAIAADGVHWSKMTIYVDNQPIGEFTSSPARTWWTLQLGSHIIKVTAVDDQGKMLQSDPVNIVVTQ